MRDRANLETLPRLRILGIVLTIAMIAGLSCFYQRASRHISSTSGAVSSSAANASVVSGHDPGTVASVSNPNSADGPPNKSPSKKVPSQIVARLRTRSDRLLREWEQASAKQIPTGDSSKMLLVLPAPNEVTERELIEEISSDLAGLGYSLPPSKELVDEIKKQLGWSKYPKALLVVARTDGSNRIVTAENETHVSVNPTTHAVDIAADGEQSFITLPPGGESQYSHLFQIEKNQADQGGTSKP